MNLNIFEHIASLPHEWAVFFLAMIPITELRAAIPLGIEAYGLSVPVTWIFAVLGNIFPTIFILLLMPRLHDWVIKQRFLGPTARHFLERAERRFSGRYGKYGAVALMLFVAIPLPFTGAWTGSLAAFVFNIPFKRAFPLIAGGICLAATGVTLITLFAGGALRWLL